METFYTSFDRHENDDLNNIIRINNHVEEDDDTQDYDLDYDPNEMYYALQRENL